MARESLLILELPCKLPNQLGAIMNLARQNFLHLPNKALAGKYGFGSVDLVSNLPSSTGRGWLVRQSALLAREPRKPAGPSRPPRLAWSSVSLAPPGSGRSILRSRHGGGVASLGSANSWHKLHAPTVLARPACFDQDDFVAHLAEYFYQYCTVSTVPASNTTPCAPE